MRLFVFGFGYTARFVARRLKPRLEAAWGTTRAPDRMAAIEAAGVAPLPFDGAGRSEAVSEALAEASHVLVSIAPGEAGDPALAHFRNDLAALKPRALVYLSTVGVYGDHGGAWIDEASACRPVSARSRRRLEAEAAWRLFGEETGTPVAILRLAGIYGPGRSAFDKLRDGTARRTRRGPAAPSTSPTTSPPRLRTWSPMRRSCSGYLRRRKSRSTARISRPWRAPSTARTSGFATRG